MKENLREIIFILDKSGSMYGLQKDVIGSYNAFIDKQIKCNLEVKVTTVLSSNSYELINDCVSIESVKHLTENEYVTMGTSSIFDALGKTIDDVGKRLCKTLEWERPKEVIFVILTDGFDCISKTYTYEKINKIIHHQKEKYNWGFIYLISELKNNVNLKLNSSINEDNELLDIFNYAEKYLVDNCPENIDLLNYFNIEKSYSSINEVSEILIICLQNRNIMPKIIKFNENKDIFKNILFDFSPEEILFHYNNEEILFNKFKENFQIKNAESKKNLWYQYAKSIISVCKFLIKFKNEKYFDNFINSFNSNMLSKTALINILTKEIYGLGFSLACEFLIKLGYSDYPIVDVNLKEIFYKLNICKDDEYEVFKEIVKMAELSGKTAYHVYKMLYINTTGDYYLNNIKLKESVVNFINGYSCNHSFMEEAAIDYK